MKDEKKPPASPSTKKKAGRLRRWFRRIAYLVGLFVIFASLLNFILLTALPKILESEAAEYGLTCTYDRLSFSLFTSDIELWHLEIAPLDREKGSADSGERFVDLEYCRADVVVHELLLGNLEIRRVEVDGMDLWIERDTDGTFPVLSRFETDGSDQEEATKTDGGEKTGNQPVENDNDAKKERLDLSLFFKLHAFRLQHVYAHFTDKTRDPWFETRFEANVRVSHVGTESRPVRFEVALTSLPVLESARLEGHCSITPDEIAAVMDVAVRGLHPMTVASYLTPFGFTPYADSITFCTHAEVNARVNDDRPDTVRLQAETTGVRLVVDDSEAVALDRFSFDASHLNGLGAELADVSIEGVRANATRDAERNLRAVGFRFHAPEPREEDARPETPEPAPEKSNPFRIGPPKVAVRDVTVAFVDVAVSPAANLVFSLKRMTVNPVSGGEVDPAAPAGVRLDFDGLFALPGIAETVRLTGLADPFSSVKRVDLQGRSEGIVPDALAPYLSAAGIEPLIENGSFAFDVSAVVDQTDEERLVAELQLTDVLFSDDVPLLGLGGLTVEGVTINSATNAITVDEIALAGTRCDVRLDEENRLQVCGLAIPLDPTARSDGENAEKTPAGATDRPASSIDESADASRESADPAGGTAAAKESKAPLPSLCIEKLIWSDNRFNFCDATRSPVRDIAISDLGFEAAHVTFDPGSEDLIPEPAALRAWFRAPGLADSLVMKGTLSSEKRELSFSMDVRGKGITAEAAAPYLETAGCRPALDDGRLRLNLESWVELDDSGMEASLALTELSFSDGDTEWLGWDALRVDSFKAGPVHPSIHRIEITKPRARARRLGTGALEAGGFVFGPPSAKPDSSKREAGPEKRVGHAEVDSIKVEKSDWQRFDAAAETAGADAILFALNELTLTGAELFWNDLGVHPAVDTSLEFDLKLDGFEAGIGADSVAIDAEIRVPGALDAFTVQGTAGVDPENPRTKLRLHAKGMRAGPLGSYITGPMAPALEHGIFKANIEAGWSRHEAGGRKGGLSVLDLEFRDGEDGPMLLSWNALEATMQRLDLDDGVVALENILLSECGVRIRQNAKGDLALMGVAIPTEKPESDVEDAAVEADLAVAATEPLSEAETATAPKRLRKWGDHPPLVTLDDLLLELTVMAEMENPETGEIEEIVTSFNVHDAGPIRLLGKEPDTNPPVEIDFQSRVEPGLGAFEVAIDAAPFAPEPHLYLDLLASGIAAQPLIERVPGLSDKIDGKGLEDGWFKGRIETRLIAKRRSAFDFDLSKGFGLEIDMKGFEFRDRTGGPVLAGLDELFLDVEKIRPETGEVRVDSLEIAKPVMHVVQEEDGMHLLGLVVKEAETLAEDPEPQAINESAEVDEEGVSPKPEVALADATGGEADGETAVAKDDSVVAEDRPVEIKVDRIYLTDIDFSMQDRSVDPPLIVPLDRLDVEVRDFTTRAFVEPHPVRFSVHVGSGTVPLPERSASSGIFSALGGAVTDLAGMGEDRAMQERPLFDEIAVNGRIVMQPELRGWVNATVNALELGGFTGVVEESGVNLNDGVFDADVALRFRNDGSLLTEAKFDMTYLKLSEPANGLISRYLKLPAPLDVVVFLLRDEDGVISIPLHFEVGADGMSAARVTSVATSTLGSLITDAVASSPFRIVGGALGDLNLLAGEEDKPDEQGPYMTLAFEPGDTLLNSTAMQQLDNLAECLDDGEGLTVLLRHELSARDIELANRRANPSQEECLELSRRFRRERRHLDVRRERLAAQAVAAVSAGLDRDADLALDRIRALDREAGMLEKSFDDTLTLLQASAERRAPRRTRGACIELGLTRLEKVKRFLIDRGVIDAAKRIKISRPRLTDAPAPDRGEVQVILKGSNR